jgi:hypothetical protein
VQSSPSRNRSMTPPRVTRPPGAKVPRNSEVLVVLRVLFPTEGVYVPEFAACVTV